MEKMSFVSRETANAAKIYNEMLSEKDCTIFLTLEAQPLQLDVCIFIEI